MQGEEIVPLLQYIEITGRMRGKKAFMLTKTDYDSLLAAENLQAALRRLETTRYKPYISNIAMEDLEIGKIEESLMEAYQAEVRFILLKLKNKNAVNLLWWINRSYKLKFISSILKSIILGIEWEKAVQYIAPYGKIDLTTAKSLLDGKNIKSLIQMISYPEEKKLVIEIEKILKEALEPTKQALEVETIINKFTIEKIWEKLASLTGKDKTSVKLVGLTLDAQTILSILRMKKLDFKHDEIERFIPSVQFKLSKNEMSKAIAASTEKDAIKVFTGGYYVDLISPLVSTYEINEDLSIFEVTFKRHHAKECEKMFNTIFYLGEALGYMYLRWYEMRDLAAILIGKYFAIPDDGITSSLILHQPPYPIH